MLLSVVVYSTQTLPSSFFGACHMSRRTTSSRDQVRLKNPSLLVVVVPSDLLMPTLDAMKQIAKLAKINLSYTQTAYVYTRIVILSR
jgi:hypothetical protein